MPATTSLTKRAIRYIKKNRFTMPGSWMAAELGVGKRVVNRYLRKHGLSVKELYGKFKGLGNRGKSSSNLATDIYLEMNYLEIGEKPMSKEIGRSSMFVRTRLKQLELIIPRHIIEERKKATQIKTGNVPANKGKKQAEYMSPEAMAKAAATQFKKGNEGPATKYDGAITIRKYIQSNGVEKRYKHIRISKSKWVMLHVKIWEDKHGPVPEGKIVVFRDKDTMNTKLSNLKLVDRKEHMLNNTIHRFPTELKQVIRLKSKLKRRTNELIKRKTSA